MAKRSLTLRRRWLARCASLFCCLAAGAGAQTAPAQPDRAAILIEPERVFDGVDGTMHPGWRPSMPAIRFARKARPSMSAFP